MAIKSYIPLLSFLFVFNELVSFSTFDSLDYSSVLF